jgi:hypothetical protein
VADAINGLVRLAMPEEWDAKCVWCKRPLFFNEMKVDQLIPKSLSEEGNEKTKAETLELHGLDAEPDLHALENLAPSCRPCNSGTGAKPPPDAPAITLLLAKAREKAPGIRGGRSLHDCGLFPLPSRELGRHSGHGEDHHARPFEHPGARGPLCNGVTGTGSG